MAEEEVKEVDMSEILSQNEVESILASIDSETSAQEVSFISKEGKKANLTSQDVQPYDFRSPVFLNPSQMRRLRIKHEDFIRGLSASLSLYLRMEFGLQMSRLETIAYKNMVDMIPVPSHITLFHLKPLAGVCMFDITPRLGLTVLDRMMGGPGHSVKVEREFTDIEIAVLQNFIRLILKQYTDSWLRYKQLEYEVMGNESTARFLNIADPDEIMLYLEMEARFGDCVAGMRFMIPYRMIEGMVEQLMAEISSEKDQKIMDIPKRINLDSASYNIPVPVSAHWRGLSMTLNEIRNLTPNDVILLDEKVCEKVAIDLGTIPKFKGILDRSNQNLMVTITEKME